ncbi:MAG: ferritin-like domain-containing protein [Clostridiales bacterium]|nr:ferritin-like domain-containing protein [Clostridiales bacterium]
MLQLTQKEMLLLKDLKEQEQVCVEKYNKYAMEANDGQLKNLFTQIAQVEQQHLDTINQIIGGTVPSMQSGQSNQIQQTFTPTYNVSDANPNKQKDSYLCTDLLSTEKHVSSTYNTSIFEFRDKNIREVLNHIQKEEQQHGEYIYNYMAQNGMYS